MFHWTIWGREPGVHEASLRRYGSTLVYHITVYFLFTLVTVTCKYSTLTQLTYHFSSYNSCSNWRPHPHRSKAVHRLVVSTSSQEQLRVRLPSVWMSATISMLYFLVAGLEEEVCEVTWHESLPLFLWEYLNSLVLETPVETDMELVTKIVVAYFIIQNASGICQGAAESCTSMSFLHWGWWPSNWATVVRCKMVR